MIKSGRSPTKLFVDFSARVMAKTILRVELFSVSFTGIGPSNTSIGVFTPQIELISVGLTD